MTVEIEAKCRKCPSCLRARAREWANRAQLETTRSSRTWFGTLTLRPEAHYLMLCRALQRTDRGGVAFEGLTPPEQFAERHEQISKEITLWLKRIRKNSGAKLRYFLVAEAHKSGLPHYHVLLHESGVPVTHSILSDAWRLGFTKFKLVDTQTDARKTSWYVCKYLTKSASAKIRASTHYGKQITLEEHMFSQDQATGDVYLVTRNKVRISPPELERGFIPTSAGSQMHPLVGDPPRGD